MSNEKSTEKQPQSEERTSTYTVQPVLQRAKSMVACFAAKTNTELISSTKQTDKPTTAK